MIVVDVNVVVHLLAGSGKNAAARSLWERDHDWCLPALWRHEFLNVLATLTRENYLTQGDAVTLWERGVALFADAERAVDWVQALELAIRNRISAYDAQYVALAESLKTTLVTEDARLRKAFPRRCLSLEAAVAMSENGS